MTRKPQANAWTPDETDLLVEMWRVNASFPEMMAALPRHASHEAIKQRAVVLRRRGVSLPSRVVVLSPEERSKRNRARVKAWRAQLAVPERTIPDFAPAQTILFTDNVTEDSFVTKIIPADSLASSPSASTAAWAVRG